MIFAITDDDTNFFTRPEMLDACYSEVWDVCPVSLSCVPFQACTKTGGIPREYWSGDEVFPLGDNGELVQFLRKKIRKGHVSISLHGYSHKDEPEGYEFAVHRNFENRVREGKEYLEKVLETKIRMFVPPHNALSREGWKAVVSNGFGICGGAFGQRGLRPCEVYPFVRKKFWNKILRKEYPFPITYSTHVEINYHTLTPSSSPVNLERNFGEASRSNGVFCLATHYWEFDVLMRSQPGTPMKDVFQQFWNMACSDLVPTSRP